MARRTRIRLSQTKTAIQHSGSFLENLGFASSPDQFEIMVTETGGRTASGVGQTTKESATTDVVCNIGDIIKYVNLFIQICPRPGTGAALNQVGWLEWAFVCVKESEANVPPTQLGVQTLGDVCTKMFRNECIYTGAIPTGSTQANYAEIKIKIPKFKQKIRIGDEWRFISFFRSSLSTDMTDDTNRLVKSFMYKCYS